MTDSSIKSIAVLTSGGDSPGMNCAIRSIVRTALGAGLKVYGIRRGYSGLLDGSFEEMNASSVGNIIQHGGTILQTSRCPEFLDPAIRKEAFHILKRKKIDALIVIGGNGSYNGAFQLYEEHGFPVVGVPGTIDNDIQGTEYTIGFDTAVQTAVEAVDKIRDTASSHARTFIVEVMGRKSSAIALQVGICTGAENIVLPDQGEPDFSQISQDVKRGIQRGKSSSIIICAEGEKPGLSYRIQECLKNDHNLDAHVCILGHIQRGGNPTAHDRLVASQMGNLAVKALLEGKSAVATAFVNGQVIDVPLKDSLEKDNKYNAQMENLAKVLSI